MKAVIIGMSAAGLSCLDTLLRVLPGADITVISAEKYSPYCRCLLTYYLGGKMREDQMTIKDPSSQPQNVHLIFGDSVADIAAARKTVVLSSGRKIDYDKLLIAVGASAVKPEYLEEQKRAFTLRDINDAGKIAPFIKEKAIVLGGGFVGIKTALGLIERKTRVDMIISSAYPLSMVLDEGTGRFIERDLKKMGIGIATNEDISGIEKNRDTVLVSLKSGRELATDVVVVGKGVKPRVGLARKSGISIDLGITVNEFLETSAKDIYAAGDCCETMDIARKKPWINAVWPVAVEQGYFAGLNMAGIPSAYPGSIGVNSLKTGSFHLISGGTLKERDGITIFEKYLPSTNQMRKLAVRDNVPVGMAFYNSPEDAGVVINLIKRGMPLNVRPEKIVNGEATVMDILKPL
jgi:nitrite reductase (NADH) large subunit